MATSRSIEGREVVVIGAGCAGLAAAVRLAAKGIRVTVIEEAPRLGGRATAFVDRESGIRLDNGQHALFGCYRETYEFLRAIGTADLAPLDSTLTLTMADVQGRAFTLTCPSTRPPFHLVRGVLSWRAIPMRDRVAAMRLAGLMWAAWREGPAAAAAWVPTQLTVTEWLRQHGQPASLREWLWNPLAYAALNQNPDIASAQPFVRVVAELFGSSPSASALGIPAVPLDELYAEPAVQYIESRGGCVRRKVSARVAVDPVGANHRVLAGDEQFSPAAIISAVPWHGFGRLFQGPVPARLTSIADAASKLASSPIVTVNLWFDAPVMSARQIGLIGTAFHWVFKKNISVSMEAGSSGPASPPGLQTRPPTGSPGPFLYSLVASGAERLLRQSNEELAALAERELRRCLPAAASATCLRSLVVREARATFSLAPDAPERPPTDTPVPGFFLAGDWIDTGLPGTIESAVMSGHRAAEAAMIAL